MRNKSLMKKARRPFKGYPMASIAFYGPTDQLATKIAVGIILQENSDTSDLRRWFSKSDIREDEQIAQEIEEFIKEHTVKSVVLTDKIIGCPHEEGKDYPDGEVCPECPFWAGRDRWTGEVEQ